MTKEISSRDNPTVKRLHALAHSARDRRKHGETLLDGVHLIDAALAAGWPIKSLIVAAGIEEHGEIAQLRAKAPAAVQQIVLADTLFAHVSPVDTPSGILALIDLPAPTGNLPFRADVLALDGIQDPGNLGTILRTAAAAGVHHVLLGEGCAQAWAPRVLRAGMGAHFLLQLEERVDLANRLVDFPGSRIATALGEGSQGLFQIDIRAQVAWLFGAEGQGLSSALLAMADRRVSIPMCAGVESLNVGAAVAVCLFEQVRQRSLR